MLAGTLGVGPFLKENPGVPPVLYALSGAVLLVYGLLTVRSKPTPSVEEVAQTQGKASEPSSQIWPGFLLGLSLILLNPAAIITWDENTCLP